MKIYSKEELNNHFLSLTYDDLSLIPTVVSQVKTRTEVNIKLNFMGVDLSVPVVSSPMDSVTGIAMAKELNSLGSLGVVNRFGSTLNELFVDGKIIEGIKAVSISLAADDSMVEAIADNNL
ncbi:MAG: hypothetical protein C0412_04305, partial [Flavobacterium sp.]|nr:hypothetical protein [Flavobacterium sp.]